MALDATVAGASADSYVTLAEANTYFSERLHASKWTGADVTKENALRMAAYRMEQEEYQGSRFSVTQALAFPRSGVYFDDVLQDSDAIPERVKRAQCELALVFISTDLFADTGLEAFDSIKVGPVALEVAKQVPSGALPEAVLRELGPALIGAGGRNSIRLFRA